MTVWGERLIEATGVAQGRHGGGEVVSQGCGAGYADAQYNLGVMLLQATGVAKDSTSGEVVSQGCGAG